MSRKVLNLDHEWKFHKGEIETVSQNTHKASYEATKAGFAAGPAGKCWNDVLWRTVDLPHDYLCESDFSPENPHSSGYRTRSNAWYRKSFVLDESLADREIFICFEGTAINAEFYFNGSLIDRSFSAYTENTFNITDRVYTDGRSNTLAVHINGMASEGWWYEGAGIYRHVRMYAKDKVHIAHNGVFGKPVLKKGTKNSWVVEVETELENSLYENTVADIRATIFDGERVVASTLTENVKLDSASTFKLLQKLNVSRPTRWDVDNPKLYTLRVEVIRGGEVVDNEDNRIGFRTFYVDADKGFFLNDRHLKIKGTGNHQDHAGVGAAIPDSVHYYRIKRLKEMGTNAYRCGHNVHAKEVLNACDELGIIVMDENRRFETREEVLGYLDTMVKRDRNHPSVIFYSLFNEEPLQNAVEGQNIYRRMKARIQKLDNTRLFTGAINGQMEGTGLEMDITGINYGLSSLDGFHKMYPNQPIIGAENNSSVATRGCYKTDRDVKRILSCYDDEKVRWGSTVRECWEFVRHRDYIAGIFTWTGIDHRGEPIPFVWPSVSSQFGAMDTCGFAKDSFYFNKACFADKPMVHLLPHWNHKRGDVVRVMAVSNCDEVELFLNGKSLGRKPSDPCAPAEWQVEYVPGRIVARAYRNGKQVAKTEQRTAGRPYAVKICPVSDKIMNDGADTAILNCCVVDRRGVVVPDADHLIHFDVIGDAYVRGVGNGNPNSHEADYATERHVYCGWCQALVTSNIGAKGIQVRAWADKLESDTLTFEVVDVPAPNCPKNITNYLLDGFTMSDVTAERPDPLIELADDDMNSFIPLGFGKGYQMDFNEGWRIYRVTPTIYSAGTYSITFSNIVFDSAEFYINGKLLETTDHFPLGQKFVTKPFEVEANSIVDIRVLMYKEKRPGVQTGSGLRRIPEMLDVTDQVAK